LKEVIVMTNIDDLLELIEGALSDNDRWRRSHAWYPTVASASLPEPATNSMSFLPDWRIFRQ
jgi:hypothetical protein